MMKYWKLGCRWGSKKEGLPLFYDLLSNQNIVISWIDKDFRKGNCVLLTDGFKPIAIAVTTSERKPIQNLKNIEHLFIEKQINFDEKLFYYDADIYHLENVDFQYKLQGGISQVNDETTIANINRLLTQLITERKMDNIISLLKHKKQIILQGPPGTGKTRLAKEIANELSNSDDVKNTFSISICKKDIASLVKTDDEISTASGKTSYQVIENDVKNERITLKRQNDSNDNTSYTKIVKAFNTKLWEQKIEQNDSRRAASLAKFIYDEKQENLINHLIKNYISEGVKFPNLRGDVDYYKIISANDYSIKISSESINNKNNGYNITVANLVEKLKVYINGYKPKSEVGNEHFQIALAKYLHSTLKNKTEINSNNTKLIQFHPSYTYEDFVRGITVKSGLNGLEYITENKVLGKIAKEAHYNYLNGTKNSSELINDEWVKEQFDKFKKDIQKSIDVESKFYLGNTCYVVKITKSSFEYKGDNWTTPPSLIPFEAIINCYNNEIYTNDKIEEQYKEVDSIKNKVTYYKHLIIKFKNYVDDIVLNSKIKNYVLIIDEINRANLSSVLGELIYALEYRGEPVESMYEMDGGGNTIILPPNLYIIGTMNTADRSVGQIDYAIRRRFAFVDVLPKELDETTLEDDLKFNTESFNQVAKLFVGDNNNLSGEFKAKDVQLGHSYFIHKENEFNLNLEYEIKPILREYVADGILKDNGDKKILIEIENLK